LSPAGWRWPPPLSDWKCHDPIFAAGSHIRSPRHVTLTFSEALEPAFSGALLMDSDGRNFSGAPVKVDGSVMTLTPDRLAPGLYHVSWHAVGHDTHRTEGEISFIVVK